MKTDKQLLLAFVAFLALAVTPYAKAEDTDPAASVVAIIEYKGAGIILKSSAADFENITKEICKLSDEQQVLAVRNILWVISASYITVIDKDQKLKLLITDMTEGRLPVDEKILPIVLQYIDSREDTEIFELAAKLLLNRGQLILSAPDAAGKISGTIDLKRN